MAGIGGDCAGILMMFSTGGWIGVPGLGDPVAHVQGKAAVGLSRHSNGGQRVYKKAEQVAAERQRILGGQVIIGHRRPHRASV